MLARRPLAALAVLALLAAGGLVGFAVAESQRAGEPVVRDALAQSANPRGAKGRTLALTRVVVKPGAKLALHHHPGTQIGYIQSGTLTYTVESGKTVVKEGQADDGAERVRTIRAGETARIRTGQWVVEQPSSHHHAANRGGKRIVILLSTLFPDGAPPSLPG